MGASFYRTVTIPAAVGTTPGVLVENVHGRVFATIAATTQFQVRADNRSAIEQSLGRYFGNPESEEFSKLTFYNYSTAANIVTYYAGDQVYKPDSSVATISASVTTSGKNAPTYLKGSGVITIISGLYTDLDGTDSENPGKTRRQIVIKNRSTSAGTLELRDSSSRVCGELAPGDPPWTIEHSGFIRLAAVGGNCSVTVGSTFYS